MSKSQSKSKMEHKDVFLQNHRGLSQTQTLPGFVYCWTGHSSPASSQGWFLCRYSSFSKMSPAASPVLVMWQDKYQESHSNNCATTTRVLWKKVTCWPWFMARQEQETPNWKRNTMKRMTMYCGKAAVVKDYTTFRWENLDLPFYGHWTTKNRQYKGF